MKENTVNKTASLIDNRRPSGLIGSIRKKQWDRQHGNLSVFGWFTYWVLVVAGTPDDGQQISSASSRPSGLTVADLHYSTAILLYHIFLLCRYKVVQIWPGLNLCVNKCKQSRSYLNHLVFWSRKKVTWSWKFLQEDVFHDFYFSPNINATMKDIWE